MSRRNTPRPSLHSIPVSHFRRKLLRWFDRHQRHLPWRKTTDPYRIWVSEIMLQQTQVATVLPYYQNFLRRFPNVKRLAAARESEVLSAWAGLGYYRRARHLHRAAKIIVQKHGGSFPDGYDAVLALPGIGKYTAGAILSIAFKKRYPVLDGNVQRVLSRGYALRGDLKSARHQKILWSIAQALVPAGAAGDFNQALMELGATVCLPRQPQCPRCPVEDLCGARRLRLESSIPQPQRSVRTQKIRRLVAVIRNPSGRLMLVQRHGKTLLKNFWEFPSFDVPAVRKQSRAEVSGRTAQRFEKILRQRMKHRFGLSLEAGQPFCTFTHTVTFRHLLVTAYALSLKARAPLRRPRETRFRWIEPAVLKRYLFDSASLKILSSLPPR